MDQLGEPPRVPPLDRVEDPEHELGVLTPGPYGAHDQPPCVGVDLKTSAPVLL
jgi:hypothetical protein